MPQYAPRRRHTKQGTLNKLAHATCADIAAATSHAHAAQGASRPTAALGSHCPAVAQRTRTPPTRQEPLTPPSCWSGGATTCRRAGRTWARRGRVAACQRAGWTGWAHADSGSPDGARNELHDGDAEHKPRHGSWRCREGLGTCDGAGTRSTVYTAAMDTVCTASESAGARADFQNKLLQVVKLSCRNARQMYATAMAVGVSGRACLWSAVGVRLTAQFTGPVAAQGPQAMRREACLPGTRRLTPTLRRRRWRTWRLQ